MEYQLQRSVQSIQPMQSMPSVELCRPNRSSKYSTFVNHGEQGTYYDANALSRLHEVFLIVMIACSILTFIVLCQLKPTENHGWAFFLSSCFGAMDYLMPLYMLYAAGTLYLHWRQPYQGSQTLILKLIGATLLYLSIDTAWQSGEIGRSISSCFFGSHYSIKAFVVITAVIISSLFLITNLSCFEIAAAVRNGIMNFFSRKDIQYPTENAYQKNQSQSYSMGGREPNLISYEKPFSQPFIHDPQSNQLISCLKQFGIHAIVSGKIEGPVITQFEVYLAPGTKSSAICSRQKEIARSLCVDQVKVIEAISGKQCIAIEIPSPVRDVFSFSELKYELEQCKNKKLPLLLGKTATGDDIRIIDLDMIPHLLIAGSTRSGKTMLLQSILMSLTHHLSPNKLQIILCDPKMVSFTAWKNIPHLSRPVITNAEEAVNALHCCIDEVEKRYQIMSQSNQYHFTKVVFIIDEVADLMMTHKVAVELAVTRLAQKARQSGIHLILSTQRPTVDIVTGHIKTNIPGRIALSVPDKISSRNILDENAENLLGHGDMLFIMQGFASERLHAPFISDDEIKKHVLNITQINSQFSEENTTTDIQPALLNFSNITHVDFKKNNYQLQKNDLYERAVAFVREIKKASTTRIQNEFGIGYQKAAAIMERMETEGVISKQVK